MGNFYTNYTIKGPRQHEVAAALAGRKAVVACGENGCVVVFDKQSDHQDEEEIAALAAQLSARFNCPVLAVMNHDDDILWYQLYESGKLTDEYDSSPGYFDPDEEFSAPAGGDAARLASAFGTKDVATVEAVLRKSDHDDDGYTFAVERHEDLVRALGLPEFAVGYSYISFGGDEFPEGLSEDGIVRTQ